MENHMLCALRCRPHVSSGNTLLMVKTFNQFSLYDIFKHFFLTNLKPLLLLHPYPYNDKLLIVLQMLLLAHPEQALYIHLRFFCHQPI